MPNWYSSSGDTGDIIFQLCACKAHNEYYYGGEPFDFYLFHHPGKTMHGMNPDKAASIGSLLKTQYYINDVIFTEEHKDSNVNGFRNHYNAGNLIQSCLSTLGMPNHLDQIPWMQMEEKIDCDVVIARSHRYRGELDYNKVLEKYGSKCIFIGLYDEWQDFTKNYGFVEWAFTPNLLEVAKYINGSKLFVGNQSCPNAISLALGKRSIQEVSHEMPNCIVNRDNIQYSWNFKHIELPDL